MLLLPRPKPAKIELNESLLYCHTEGKAAYGFETGTRNGLPTPQGAVRPGLSDTLEHYPGRCPRVSRGAGRGHLRPVRCDELAADRRHLCRLSHRVERVPDAGVGVCVGSDPARFARPVRLSRERALHGPLRVQ